MVILQEILLRLPLETLTTSPAGTGMLLKIVGTASRAAKELHQKQAFIVLGALSKGKKRCFSVWQIQMGSGSGRLQKKTFVLR